MSEDRRKVLVVEDDARIFKFLRLSLEANGYIVFGARLGEEGLDLCQSQRPDLVILDLGLPDIDGRQFIVRLREWSRVPIIVLSVRALEEEKIEALDAGANDYMTKPFGIGELMARTRVLIRGSEGAQPGPSVFESNGLRIDRLKREVSVDAKSIHLSKKEYELLRLLVEYPGQVLTHEHIAQRLWERKRSVETQHLRVLVRQLRQKLGDEPTDPRFIVTVQGVGYRLALSESS
jgi:two-component system KDP operon response regulator KdpE